MKRTPVADWQQLSALYELADALDGDALADWLEQLRLQAHPLLPQLRQMLEARAQVRHNGFLGSLPQLTTTRHEPRAVEWPAWQADTRIGPYRLLSRLGSGGMAEVWLAQRDDGAFQRRVAIKLLFRHAGSNALDSFAQRFDRERDILASLNHPHIAGLHDAGVTATGQPWLALEYVEGQMLTTWCDERCLGIEARVRLFRQVLLAVQHAHANLVIHRDLKPGNILVTAQGEVRLLDFGIAKLMEPEGAASVETELTRMAGRPMTPQYASPEQLLGQPLTTACDVYSLGVVLYELLCGERPYELKVESAAQLEQAILDMEPRAPSRRLLPEPIARARGTTSVALRKQLGSDLDAIVLRALAKQPTQRYGSVEALGADLDRWLGGEPVEARAPSTVYRVGKFVRRHTLSVSLGVAAILTLAGVAAVAVVMGLQAREDSARAVAARDFMLNIFQRANQEKSRGADITARDLLETGRKDVLTRLAGQPKLQAELLRGIAKVQSDMGEYVSADGTFAELVGIYGRLRQPREEAMARSDHAWNALQMNSPLLADRLLQGAKAVGGRPVHDAELNARLAEVEGWAIRSRGEARQAQQVLTDARATAKRELGPEHLRTFRLGQALYATESDLANFDGALALHEELRAVSRHVPGLDAGEAPAMDWEHVNLLISAGRLAQAAGLVDAAMARCVNELGAQEQSCRMLFVDRAYVLLGLGKVASAMDSLPRLQAMSRDATFPFLQIRSLLLEFRLQSMATNDSHAPPSFEHVAAFGRSGAEVAMKPTFKADALLALSEFYLRRGGAQEAQRWARMALDLLGGDANRGAAGRLVAMSRMMMGIALLQQGQAARALDSLREAQAGFARVLGPEHLSTQLAALNVALAFVELKRMPDATALVVHAEPILRDSLGEDAPLYRQAVALQSRLEARSTAGAGPSSTASTGLPKQPVVQATAFFR